MSKIRFFLWIVVYAYLIYALIKDGPSSLVVGLLILATLTVIMQAWLHSENGGNYVKNMEWTKKKTSEMNTVLKIH